MGWRLVGEAAILLPCQSHKLLEWSEPASGPLSIGRYNLFRSADILGGAAPGYSTGQALEAAERVAASALPSGFGFEWTGMSYQGKKAGSNAAVFALALLLVVLLLAAQYESWIIPIAVVLRVPAGVLGAIFTEWSLGIPDDVYCRIGLIMLIGLAAKNAILIVEFARQRREAGVSTEEAALEAARLRFRPILMTSFAFILGVVPLVIASGAGSASRRSLGSAVFGGMLFATVLGVFMIPTFYVWVQRFSDRYAKVKLATAAQAAAIVLGAVMLQSCVMGPNYKAPQLPAPAGFRNAAMESAKSMGDVRWADLFEDTTLRGLLAEALRNNYDLRIAAQNILEARAQVTTVRSNQFPFVNGAANLTNREIATGGSTPLPPGVQREATFGNTLLDFTFQLDFWGRYRRLTEAARGELLAQESAQRVVTVSLIADVATTYFQLIELDRELEIAKSTLTSRRESLRLVKAREDRGVASGLDVSQAENLVFTASARIPALERQANILENALSVLLARNPGAIENRRPLGEQKFPSEIPPGLPADLLKRRPDLQQAEALLQAANARIGVATASQFPQFSLSAVVGLEGLSLERFFSGTGRLRQVGPGMTAPIFNSGALRANVRAAKARAEAASIEFERTFQNALRETSDSLIGLSKTREQRLEQERLLVAVREANQLSRLLYEGVVSSYLQVLDADRNLFDAEVALAQVQREELLAVVRLYRALGGGWQ